MALNDNRREYDSRMHRVLAHIDAHLDEPLDLATLAQVAHFSDFHFHRLFSAWMGETLGDYVRRRRVELAAVRLVAQPRVAVLNIALSVGFGSGEAFARAFKLRFGCSPSAWREQEREVRQAQRNELRNAGQANSKPDQALLPVLAEHAVSRNMTEEFPMHVTLVDRPPATIAYFRHLGPYGEPVARFWQDTYAPWAAMIRLGADHARYGISHDDPGITAPAQCRYDACAEVPADFTPTGGALKATLAGGTYAVLRFKGTVEQVGGAWDALLRDWLPASGLQLDARPCFEYYPKDAAFDGDTGVFECDICIPVMPL